MQIEKNIPPPSQPGKTKYPFRCMEVGDSILCRGGAKNGKRARRAAGMAGQRHGMRFVCRSTPEGMRIWRVE